MGNTTIIELNHDLVDEIFTNELTEQAFLGQIRSQLGSFHYNGQDILGGKVIAGFHRSGKAYDQWLKFKNEIGW